jgi:hypothetical protein
MVRFRPFPFWYSGSNQALIMARYRIVRRPSVKYPETATYDVERFSWPFIWTCVNVYLTLEGAKAYVDECKEKEDMPPIKREVVWESER